MRRYRRLKIHRRARRIRERRASAGRVGQARFVKLRDTFPALADVDAILDCITAHSPQGARRVQACIRAIIELLLLYYGIGMQISGSLFGR